MVLFVTFILFIAVAVACLAQRNFGKATLCMLGMGFSYLLVIVCIIIYLSKDAYYYNSLYHYFGITRSFQNQLLFLPISRELLIRFFNISSMLFLYFSLAAAILLAFHIQPRRQRILLSVLAVPGLLQTLGYDPRIYAWLYYRLYPDYLTSQAIAKLYDILHSATLVVNNISLAAGVALIFYMLAKTPRVRQLRTNAFMILLCYLTVQLTYAYINFWAPNLQVTVSKAAHFIRYNPIILAGPPFMYTLLPYISIFGLLISVYAVYRYSKIQNSIRNDKAVISRNIDSALLTSRVFSHYLKNEMLALMAQSEFLEMMCENAPELVPEIRVIEDRCRSIYDRLDDIHRKALTSKIDLKPLRIIPILEAIIQRKRQELTGIDISMSHASIEPLVMADSYYLGEALEQLLTNAYEALTTVKRKAKEIHVDVQVRGKWAEIGVRDNGPGIPEEIQEQMFEPFYSSKPTSTNWGMGLSMCRSIIASHDGKIKVESRLGEGTIFLIVLPLFAVNNYEKWEEKQ
ncbi:HAMP domain-containing sensor histidine kinase [Paenibacillus sp. HB172176]|uniref:sensor histidine kinase n=1 Tax=Paenibacillus sp. HB172176 TaxID=2493690 RepID=UPI00143BCFB3|nr:HAMP domain-containing sensor histidine kinase [Paenibacillus sp. HB172176]